MPTLLERAPLDRYRAEARRYLGGLPEIDLDANLAEAKRNQTAYAGTPVSVNTLAFCCTIYKPDCDRSVGKANRQ